MHVSDAVGDVIANSSIVSEKILAGGAQLVNSGSVVGVQKKTSAETIFKSVTVTTRREVSITDFGAIPNDGLDDSFAIQAAIDSSLDVYIPQGTFNVHSTIYLRRGLKLRGASMYGTVIDGAKLVAPIFSTSLNRYEAGAQNQGFRDGEIQQIKIVGNIESASNHAINFEHGFHRSVIRRVWFYSCGGDAIHINADNQYGGYYNTIEQNVFGDPSDFSSGIDSSLIRGNGIYAVGSSNQNIVRENVFWRVKQNSIQLVGTPKWSIQRWSILDNGIEGSGYFQSTRGYYGVRLDSNAWAINISRNYFEGNGFSPPYLGAAIFANSSMLDLTVRDNLFASNPYALYLATINGASIDGNSWVAPSTFFDIKVDAITKGLVTIGNNFSNSAIAGKYVIAAVEAQPKVTGDAENAMLRGTNLLGGTFSPRLYGGSTEITCAIAQGKFERRGNKLQIKFFLEVKSLNGATGPLAISGNEGIKVPMPSVNSIQYPFMNTGPLSASIYLEKVRSTSGYSTLTLESPKRGSHFVAIREHGDSKIDKDLDATSIVPGSILQGEFVVDIR